VFSRRTPDDLGPNRLARELAGLQESGRDVIDLTESNPTRCGFEYPAGLLAALADPSALAYAPAPLGAPAAREAVAAEYARRALDVPPERIVLTASTSDAYSLLFKVLCDPGDAILVPRPSYPLFEHLARLDAVAVSTYDLEYHGRWSIDRRSVVEGFTPRTRALLVVHPNNPTGSFVAPDELADLAGLCAARGAALVADEVFADYELVPGASRAAARPAERRDVLSFSLGGLSKSAGLPQLKLGWMAVSGPDDAVAGALARLEYACDAYLAVSTPVQVAAARLIGEGAAVRRQIQSRILQNFHHLRDAVGADSACRVLEAEGGWYAVVQVPTIETEEELVLGLLTHETVLVHPGYFFDFPRESYLVVSLLPPAPRFARGVARVLAYVRHRSAGA
jgi:aspartate/methionine/tyrosine aminotransferase